MVPEIWSITDHFFVILDCSLPFYPINNPGNQNFQKIKKTPGDIIILQMCTMNGNHIMHGCWDLEHDIILCHFGLFFALLPPWQTKKSKLWKNRKNCWRYHFTHVYHKWQSHDVWFLRFGAWQIIFCHFGLFFPFYPLENPKNQNFEKM